MSRLRERIRVAEHGRTRIWALFVAFGLFVSQVVLFTPRLALAAPPLASPDGYSVVQDGSLIVAWWDADWTKRRKIVFNNAASGTDLDEFPVLVTIPGATFDYDQTQNLGQDLRFIDATGEPLSHEVELWDELGDSYVWVKVPRIDAGSTTDSIWMYYGNNLAIAREDPAGVWSNGYVGVWHFAEDPSLGSGSIKDSTGYTNHGDPYNMDASNLQTGAIGTGLSFPGTTPNPDYIRIASTAVDELALNGTQATLEAWVEHTGATGSPKIVVGRQLGTTWTDSYVLFSETASPEAAAVLAGGYVNGSNGSIPLNQWRYIAGVRDGSTVTAYSAGVQVGQTTGLGTPIPTDANDVTIGAQENDATSVPTEPWLGRLDEVRISDVPRSADWIRAQNLSMTGVLAALDPEESAPAMEGVLGNDNDPEDDPLTAVLVSPPSEALGFTFRDDGTFVYTPNPGYTGPDTFDYKVNDGSGDSGTVTVTIAVVGGISGRVFEDVDGNLLAGAEVIGDASNPIVTGATVRVFADDGSTADVPDAGDAEVAGSPFTTGPAGIYNTGALADGKYWVVVDSKTVPASQELTEPQPNIWAEQTYGWVGSWCADGLGGTAGPSPSNGCFGGRRAAQSDDLTAWHTGAEHLAEATIVGGFAVPNVDFGFSFDAVTNALAGDSRDDDGAAAGRIVQGSLRQFLTNANALSGPNAMRFVPTEPANASDGGGNDWWQVDITTALPQILDGQTTIDGRAYGLDDGTTVLDTNTAGLGANVAVGTEGAYTTPALDPELELLIDPGLSYGLEIREADAAVRRISIWRSATVDIHIGYTGATFAGPTIEQNVIGTPPDQFDNSVTRSGNQNVNITDVDDGVISGNVIGYPEGTAVSVRSGAENWTVVGNEIRGAGQDPVWGFVQDAVGDGAPGLIVRGNLLADNAGGGFDSWKKPGPFTIEHNTFSGNGIGGGEIMALRLFGTGSTIEKNVFTNSTGPAIIVVSDRTGTETYPAAVDNLISQNEFSANGGVAIDLLGNPAADAQHDQGDGPTPNDASTNPLEGNNGLDAPAITSATTASVSGTTCALCRVELYRAVSGAGDAGFGEGVEYLGFDDADAAGDWTVAGVTTSLGGQEVSAIAIDASNNTSEFAANTTVVALGGISGRVFEDTAGDVLDGAQVIGDGANPGASGVTVTLWQDNVSLGLADAGDTIFVQGGLTNPTTTDAGGNYSFPNLPAGDYFVVVDSKTITPSAGLESGHVLGETWAEQTWAPAYGYARSGPGTKSWNSWARPFYGGATDQGVWYAESDDASDVESAEHFSGVTLTAGAARTDVDFGFSFNVVTNVLGGDTADHDLAAARTVQGSLRQFIQNANAIAGANRMRFVPVLPANDTTWWEIAVSSPLPTITGADTTIDGTAFQHADGVAVRDENPGTTGYNAANDRTVGADGVPLPVMSRPELEIEADRTIVNPVEVGIQGNADGLVVRDLAVFAFGDTGIGNTDSNIRIGPSGGSDYTGVIIERNVIGSGAGDFVGPIIAGTGAGVTLETTDGAVVRDNLIGFTVGRTIDVITGTDTLVQGNELTTTSDDVTDIYLTSDITTYEENYVKGGIHWALDFIGANGTIRNNTVANAGDGVGQSGGLRLYSDGHTVDRNLFENNDGPGILIAGDKNTAEVRPPAVAIITGNEFSGNTGLAIDLQAASGDNYLSGDGITPNNGGATDPLHGNRELDFPVITGATISGGTTTVTGTACSGCTVEIFEAGGGTGDDDPPGSGTNYHGEGVAYLGSGVATGGAFSIAVTGVSAGDEVSATATDTVLAVTSEFALNQVVVVANNPPSADAGGPYETGEGADLLLDGSGSTDPDTDPLTYAWDVDNDGSYDDASGVTPTIPWLTLVGLGFDDDGGPHPVGLQVDDGNGHTATATVNWTITNTPPTIVTSGSGSTDVGVPYLLALAVTDPGDDTVTEWTINWGDGTIETIPGNPATASHTYSVPGLSHNIVASVSDEDSPPDLPWHQGRMVVPGLFANQQLYRLEATTGAVFDNLGTATSLGGAIGSTIGPDGLAYVGSYTTDRIYRFNPVTGAYVDEWVPFQSGGLDGPAGMAFGPNGNLFVSSNFTDEVLEFDALDGSFAGVFVTFQDGGLDEPDDLVFGPDGHLYVTSFHTDEVLRYHGATGAFMNVFASGVEMDRPSELAFGPDGHLYVTSVANDHVVRYDGADGSLMGVFATKGATGLDQPRGAIFGPDGHLYVGGRNRIVRYNGADGGLIDVYRPSGSINGPSQAAFVPGDRVTVTWLPSISGRVFEDIAGDVLDDGSIGDAANPGAAGVEVYLYDGLNALVATTTTDPWGFYTFRGLADDTYTVRVDSRTVPSAQDPTAPQGDIWAVQTYGPDTAPCANGTGSATPNAGAGSCYGGSTGAVSDGDAFWNHRVVLTVAGSGHADVDFGFSFNAVVNTRGGDATDDDAGANRTVQGSVRQFIQNANAIAGPNTMRFVPVEPTDGTDGGGNDWWSVPITVALPAVAGPNTLIAGAASDLTDGVTPRDTNGLGPELELNGTGTAASVDGLLVTGGDVTVNDLVINRFGRDGIRITTAGSNTITGSYLGTDATGTADLGNGNNGIFIIGVPDNTIGGLGAGDGNVLSGNDNNGLLIDGGAATGNVIQGNYVGLDATGSGLLGNADDGVDLSDAPGNTVGGTDPASRNVISGQGDVGLLIVGALATGNTVQGNYIGTNAAGDAARPNGTGIHIKTGANGNTIGGPAVNAGNVVSGNSGVGIQIDTNGNTVQGNAVGTNQARTGPVANGGAGVSFDLGAGGNLIGGDLDAERNRIAYNASDGIAVELGAGTGNAFLRNEIFANSAMGIDINPAGVNPNDSPDDNLGPNNRRNYPEITSVTEAAGTLTVEFDLDVPAGNYRVEFFRNPGGDDLTGHGEGEVLAHAHSVLAHPGGVVNYSTSFAGSGGEVLTATATEDLGGSYGSTSEFSASWVVPTNQAPVLNPVGDRSVDEGVLLTFTATATDPDVPADSLTFSLVGEPAWASITPAGVFSWTPSEVQGPGSYTFDVVVTDDGTPSLDDAETITVTVGDVNVAPVADAIADQTIDELALLSLTATATDADWPANTLAWSLDSGPGFVLPSGDYSWVPAEGDGPGTYTVVLRVTDDGTGSLFDTLSFDVTVDEVNVPPVLDPVGGQSTDEMASLSFTATATDPDTPANTLTFSLLGEPAGASITAGGVFSWTPSEGQGPGSYTFDVVVTDDGTPNLNDSETITVTVNEVNRSPVADAIANQSVDELSLLSLTATATDPDLPANTLSWSLDSGPGSVLPNGDYTWTPTEADGPGTYTVVLRVADDGAGLLSDTVPFDVTVGEVNEPPVLDPVGDRATDELVNLSFTATASDPDTPPNSLTFSLLGEPAGASITAGGVFSWTPTEAQGPGSYVFDVVVTETDGSPTNLSDSETITVTVGEGNTAPVLGFIGNRAVDELFTLSFAATATDPDTPPNTLVFSLVGEPAGASITAGGMFSWTPTEAQGPGSYTFDVVVTETDGAPTNLSDSETITITVGEGNEPPALGAVGDQSVNELSLLTFTATGFDPDAPVNTLLFSLVGEPVGAIIDPNTGDFSWTPAEGQGPGSYTFDVVVTDDGVPALNDSETITVTVGEVNMPPVLDPVGDQSTNESASLGFTATASDADAPANGLTFSLSGQPAGASMTAGGVFSWTPSEAQGPGSYTFDVVVTDDGVPALNDSETITVTVGETNAAPAADGIADQTIDELTVLSLTATATDVDDPANTLAWSLDSGPGVVLPNGNYTWVPLEVDGPGTYPVVLRVTDDGSPSRSDTVSFDVTVNEANVAPVADVIADQTIDELTVLSLTATATDVDDPANTLAWSLDSGPGSVTAGGAYSWTPSEVDGPGTHPVVLRVTDDGSPSRSDTVSFDVTVNEVNEAPVADPIADQTIDEWTMLSLTATATDPDEPTNTLSWALWSGPVGASITPGGAFSWTPTEADGPGTYTVTLRVLDNGVPVQSDTVSFDVTVNEANSPPVADPIADVTIDEASLHSFTATAADGDVPSNTLTWSLSSGPGSMLPNGDYSWVPSEAQGPGSHLVVVRVTDDGVGSLWDETSFTITVNEVNTPPVPVPLADRALPELSTVTLTAAAVDADDPANSLVWAVESGPGTVSPSGVYSWTPGEADGPGTYPVTLRVTDDGVPALSATVSLDVVVTAVNDKTPVANGDAYGGITEGAPVAVTAAAGVLSNDTDADLPPDPLTVSLETNPLYGVLALAPDGSFNYDHDGSENHTDTFTYTVYDGSNTSAPATVTLTMAPVNDQPPVAVDDIYGPMPEGSVLSVSAAAGVLTNDSDADMPGDVLTAVVTAGPSHGTVVVNPDGSFDYAHDGTENFADSFDYEVSDGLATDVATATIMVAPVNDNPPVVPASSYLVDEGGTITPTATVGVLAGATDLDGDTVTSNLVTAPAHGTLGLLPDGSFSYSHDGSENFVDGFTFDAEDGINTTGPVTVTITVNSLNDVPTIDPLVLTPDETTPVGTVLGSPTAADDDGDSLIFSFTAPDPHFAIDSLTGEISSLAALDFETAPTHTLNVTVTDPTGASASADVIVNVVDVDELPVGVPAAFPVAEDLPLGRTVGTVVGSDPEGEPVSFALVGGDPSGRFTIDPLSGELLLVAALDADATPSYLLEIEVSDPGGNTAPVAVIVIVDPVAEVPPVNAAPLGLPDRFSGAEDSALLVAPLRNDSDPDGDPLLISWIDAPVNGSLAANGDGTFTYQPNRHFVGLETLSYGLSDGLGGESTATVVLSIFAVNDAPVAPDIVTTLEFASQLEIPLPGIIDPDGDPVSISVGVPVEGTVELISGGFLYFPPPEWNGTDTFSYVANDGRGGTGTGVVTIAVTQLDRELVAIDLVAPEVTGTPIPTNDPAPSNGIIVDSIPLLVGTLTEMAGLISVPLIAVGAAFLGSLLFGLRRSFLIGRGPVFLPASLPGSAAVVRVPAGGVVTALDGPGEEHPLVHRYQPAERGIRTTGRRAQRGSTLWVEVETPEGDAWIIERLLTPEIAPGVFAGDDRVAMALADLVEQIEARGDLTGLTSQHGLDVAYYASPRNIQGDDLTQLLVADESWGWWDPTGSTPSVRGEFTQMVADPIREAVVAFEPRPVAEAVVEIPVELVNFSHLTFSAPNSLGWRVFFSYENDEPKLAAIWREGVTNPAAI